MKAISKFLFALIITFATSTVFALQPSYGKILNADSKLNSKYSEVFLQNLTYESYMVYSTYNGTGRVFNLPIYSAGSSQDTIRYPIVAPDYSVCLNIVQMYTGKQIDYICAASGTFYIHYVSGKKPIVTLKK